MADSKPKSGAKVSLKPIQIKETTMDIILRAHCDAEMARATYWLESETPKIQEFYLASAAFWKRMAESKELLTDIMAIAECKRMWDDRLKTMFPNEDHYFVDLPSFEIRI